jgi:hypothetical protein
MELFQRVTMLLAAAAAPVANAIVPIPAELLPICTLGPAASSDLLPSHFPPDFHHGRLADLALAGGGPFGQLETAFGGIWSFSGTGAGAAVPLGTLRSWPA